MEPRGFDKSGDRLRPRAGLETGRALVIEPHLRGPAAAPARVAGIPAQAHAQAMPLPPDARLDEAVGLARAIELNVVASGIAPLGGIRPATFIGEGRVRDRQVLHKAITSASS